MCPGRSLSRAPITPRPFLQVPQPRVLDSRRVQCSTADVREQCHCRILCCRKARSQSRDRVASPSRPSVVPHFRYSKDSKCNLLSSTLSAVGGWQKTRVATGMRGRPALAVRFNLQLSTTVKYTLSRATIAKRIVSSISNPKSGFPERMICPILGILYYVSSIEDKRLTVVTHHLTSPTFLSRQSTRVLQIYLTLCSSVLNGWNPEQRRQLWKDHSPDKYFPHRISVSTFRVPGLRESSRVDLRRQHARSIVWQSRVSRVWPKFERENSS